MLVKKVKKNGRFLYRKAGFMDYADAWILKHPALSAVVIVALFIIDVIVLECIW